MIYDPHQHALYADDGQFIKTIYCPLADVPAHLRQFVSRAEDQGCYSCAKTVRCIDDKQDADVIKMVEADSGVCFFATASAKSITFLQPGTAPYNPAGLPVISTVRSLEAMDALQRAGYRLLIQETGIKNKFGESKYQVFEHVITGQLRWAGDYREVFMPSDEWRLVKDWFFARSDRLFPLAAYVLPPDIQPNSRVYLEDVIEDIHVMRWNQGNGGRLESTEAIWNGKTMKYNRIFKPMLLG